MASRVSITSTAGALNSMCIESFFVLEQRVKRRGNLPMLIPFGAGRTRAGVAQNVAPMLNSSALL
jgi:hypothetical protein